MPASSGQGSVAYSSTHCRTSAAAAGTDGPRTALARVGGAARRRSRPAVLRLLAAELRARIAGLEQQRERVVVLGRVVQQHGSVAVPLDQPGRLVLALHVPEPDLEHEGLPGGVADPRHQEQSPPGSNGSPVRSDHRSASSSTIVGSLASQSRNRSSPHFATDRARLTGWSKVARPSRSLVPVKKSSRLNFFTGSSDHRWVCGLRAADPRFNLSQRWGHVPGGRSATGRPSRRRAPMGDRDRAHRRAIALSGLVAG